MFIIASKGRVDFRGPFVVKGPDHLQKNLILKNHKSYAMPKKLSKT